MPVQIYGLSSELAKKNQRFRWFSFYWAGSQVNQHFEEKGI